MTEQAAIPDDLAARWEWAGCDIRLIGAPLFIAAPTPDQLFATARAFEAAAAALVARRPMKQERLNLEERN